MSDFTSREKGKQVWRKLAICCRFLDSSLSRKHPGACPWGTEHMCKLSLIRGLRPTPKDPWPCNRALGSFRVSRTSGCGASLQGTPTCSSLPFLISSEAQKISRFLFSHLNFPIQLFTHHERICKQQVTPEPNALI